jgi:DNA mismatch repair protein MutS
LFHLRVQYQKETDKLIFDRILTPGSGPRVYGLTVAKHMIKSNQVVERAEIIRKRLMKEDDLNINIPVKKSKYNRKLVVKQCSICRYRPTKDHHRELETHHINFQSDCDSDGRINRQKHLTKNELYNLVVLCRKCHTDVHHDKISIDGYILTSEGPELLCRHNEKTSLTKINVA